MGEVGESGRPGLCYSAMAPINSNRVDVPTARFRYLVPTFTNIGTALALLGGRLLAGRATL